MEILLWILMALVLYTYIGYGLVVICVNGSRNIWRKKVLPVQLIERFPSVTVVVAAYNEAAIIEEKIRNTLALDYPKECISYLFVTDGSTDGTDAIVATYPQIQLLHHPARKGKASAINRAMQLVTTEWVVFTDANAMINDHALKVMRAFFLDPTIGVVAGEKKVLPLRNQHITGAEGLYWQYESFLKKEDASMHSVVGAAGELYAIRSSLYQPIPNTTICDDLWITLGMALRGYRIAYAPGAISTEYATPYVQEEWLRKTRIAAGCMQALPFLFSLRHLWNNPLLGWQLISRKLLRWVVAPYCLLPIFLINLWLVIEHPFYLTLLIALLLQVLFYVQALLGFMGRNTKKMTPSWYLPFYFCMANMAMIYGTLLYLQKKQSVYWPKATRVTDKKSR